MDHDDIKIKLSDVKNFIKFYSRKALIYIVENYEKLSKKGDEFINEDILLKKETIEDLNKRRRTINEMISGIIPKDKSIGLLLQEKEQIKRNINFLDFVIRIYQNHKINKVIDIIFIVLREKISEKEDYSLE